MTILAGLIAVNNLNPFGINRYGCRQFMRILIILIFDIVVRKCDLVLPLCSFDLGPGSLGFCQHLYSCRLAGSHLGLIMILDLISFLLE